MIRFGHTFRNGGFHSLSSEERVRLLEAKKRDPLHKVFPNGETLLEARNRARVLFDRSSRQYAGKNVLVFSHGEYIECIWSEIAHMRTEQQTEFFSGKDRDIKNCQVVEFKSDQLGKLRTVRSSNPHLETVGEWNRIEKKTFTPKELLSEVLLYPHIIKKDVLNE